jgi:hypothetical protein
MNGEVLRKLIPFLSLAIIQTAGSHLAKPKWGILESGPGFEAELFPIPHSWHLPTDFVGHLKHHARAQLELNRGLLYRYVPVWVRVSVSV